MKEFEEFKKTFIYYQKLLGLTGYKVYFKHEPIEEGFANITINQEDMVATIRLNSELPDDDKPHSDVKCSAKHEALHLLLARLENRACERYVRYGDIYESVEEIVFKLEDLIP